MHTGLILIRITMSLIRYYEQETGKLGQPLPFILKDTFSTGSVVATLHRT